MEQDLEKFFVLVNLLQNKDVANNAKKYHIHVQTRDVEAEAGSGSGGSGTFSAKAQKIHRFRFHIGGKNGERKEIGSAILRRRTNGGSIHIKK